MADPILIQFEPCVQLERLLLAGSNKATITGLQRVLSGCSGLYSLDLSDIPAVTDELIEYVAENCPRLHTLYVGSCSSLTDDSIVKLATSCSQLKRVCFYAYMFAYMEEGVCKDATVRSAMMVQG